MFKGADSCGCTNNVVFASICFDSVNATFAFFVQCNSKLDLGESLFWPSLAAVNKLFNGVNFSAQWGINDGNNLPFLDIYVMLSVSQASRNLLSRPLLWGGVKCLQDRRNYSGSQSHTTRRGWASCSLWYATVANVCDLLLFLNENRVIPEFRYFWKVTSPDEELFTVLYFPSDAIPMTQKIIHRPHNTGMMVTWLTTLANTRP